MRLEPKSMDDFPIEATRGFCGETLDAIKDMVRKERKNIADVGRAGKAAEKESFIEASQRALDTCDEVLKKLDEVGHG